VTLVGSLVVCVVTPHRRAPISVGTRVVTGFDDYSYAVVTVLIGGFVRAAAAFVFEWTALPGDLCVQSHQ